MKSLAQRHGDTEDGRACAGREPWPRVKLGEVCESKIARLKSLRCISEIDYIDIASIDRESKRIISITKYDVAQAPGRAQQVVDVGDLLVSTVRPNLNAVALIEHGSQSQLIASTGFSVVRAKQDALPKYLFYYCQTDAFVEPLVAVSEKASYPSVTDSIVKDSTLPLPPLSVQREIVARLERELGAVEKVAAKFEELEAAAEAEFKAELKETFEDLTQRHGDTEIRRVKLGEVCEIGYGYTAKAKAISESLPRYLRITDIQNDSVDWESVPCCDCPELESYELHDGDIVFARTGATTGKSYLLKGNFPLSVFASYLIRVLIDDQLELLPEYLKYYFDSPDYWAVINAGMAGAAQGGFNSKKLAALDFPLPPLSLQRLIVARLDAAREREERLVAAAKRGREAAALWRKAILKEAFE